MLILYPHIGVTNIPHSGSFFLEHHRKTKLETMWRSRDHVYLNRYTNTHTKEMIVLDIC